LSRKTEQGQLFIPAASKCYMRTLYGINHLELQTSNFTAHLQHAMAGDTRDSSSPPPRGPPPGATEPPKHVKNTKVYEVFPANANSLPDGSGQNTAGGRPENPKLAEAIKTVRIEDFKQVHMYPCVRESLLTGIGGGFGMGAVRAVWGSMYLPLQIAPFAQSLSFITRISAN
jgi:hypothetical protein